MILLAADTSGKNGSIALARVLQAEGGLSGTSAVSAIVAAAGASAPKDSARPLAP